METDPRGSGHAEIIEFVGGCNVAEAALLSGNNLGRSKAALEQLQLWNPEVILIKYFRDGENSSFAQIMHDQGWRNIKAVQKHRVYELPNQPFNWFDCPQGVNRLIGIKWLANLLYPDIYPADLQAEVKRFYALFYKYQLSGQEIDEFLQRAQQ